MNDNVSSELNNLQLQYSSIKTMEKKLNEMSQIDSTTVEELKRLTMDIKFKTGQFDDAFQTFLMDQGLKNGFHLLDVIIHFWNKSKKTLIV